jgi:SAM-dependent methyltransferase
MVSTITPHEFVAKWKGSALAERASAQEHFIDLCRLLGQPTPADIDTTGETYTFEKGTTKTPGGQGWADVWYKGHFAWEYKGPGKDLAKAYAQLLQYHENLGNPPLLIVSDIQTIQVHTKFTNTPTQVYTYTLEDLLDPVRLDHLRKIFTDLQAFRTGETTEQVTEQAAAEFAKLAELLRKYGEEPDRTAHFLIRLLFCLFAEDVGLLPNSIFTRLVEATHRRSADFAEQLRQLFAAMAGGGIFALETVPCVDGGLFDDDEVLPLDSDGMEILRGVCKLDWGAMEPAILGTLFVRSLDPEQRAQQGAQYTSKEDILLIVEPVLMAPLRRQWEQVKAQARELAERRDDATQRATRTRFQNQLTQLLMGFADKIAGIRVLDPACGSGNFLYVALRLLLDLEKEVRISFAGAVGVQTSFPMVSPAQLHGIEINEYAHELAQATIWIGYIQWWRENGFGFPSEPILKPIETILLMDAILAYDEDGSPVEPEWPEADVIIGNPPFLGGKLLRTHLGDRYIDDLFGLYDGRVPREADLVTYWHERARAIIASGGLQRAGLLATNSIRGGANRKVLERIAESGGIFMAWGDRPWVLDGAAVRVSMVGFDDGTEADRVLDGKPVPRVNADLTSSVDVTSAHRLDENLGLSFMGDTKGGPFDITSDAAHQMISEPENPNGRYNSDVVVPWVNGLDITRRPRDRWIIDFGVDMPEVDAALYEVPFEYVRENVKPMRLKNRRAAYRERWWIHVEARPAMRDALAALDRHIATPTVAKHRLFSWLRSPTLPDHQLILVARDDDYFFGVLHARPHELWSLRMCTWLGVGNDPRYTPTTTFQTFPFPWPPGDEPVDDPRVLAIAEAARELVEKRNRWLNPEGSSEKELKRRTLTNLYNERPSWLDLAHKKLDTAVFDAYGWPHDLSDEEILERLLELNLERAAAQDE